MRMQVSQQESDPASLGLRIQRSVPHLGAVIAGGAAVWGWGRLIDSNLLEGGFRGVLYLVMLMFAPVVGASVSAFIEALRFVTDTTRSSDS